VPDNPRIEELRRRVQKDPSSIAFAQLGEEYRRAGNFEEAISTCRTGLQRHPSYLSARVTLGRALIETGQSDAAEMELEYVLMAAPENLAALRGMADVHHRRGELAEALTFYRRALSLARHDPDLEQTVGDIERVMESAPGPVDVPGGLSFAQVEEELLSLEAATPPTEVQPTAPVEEQDRTSHGAAEHPDVNCLPALEAFLTAIAVYRQRSGLLS
jgi:tetratricopeptide (TPR) repeat protein